MGTTTLAKAWARRHQGPIIETDFFTEWIFRKDFPHCTEEGEQFIARVSAQVALEYLKMGMPVAIENVWSPAGIKTRCQLLQAADATLAVKAVWLSGSLAENQRGDKERAPEDQMLARVAVVKKELEAYRWPDDVHRMDTTHRPIPEFLDLLEQLPPISRIL